MATLSSVDIAGYKTIVRLLSQLCSIQFSYTKTEGKTKTIFNKDLLILKFDLGYLSIKVKVCDTIYRMITQHVVAIYLAIEQMSNFTNFIFI